MREEPQTCVIAIEEYLQVVCVALNTTNFHKQESLPQLKATVARKGRSSVIIKERPAAELANLSTSS